VPNYPGALDALANPGPLTLRNDPGFELHSVISTLNDIAEALEAKLGTGASTPAGTAAVLRRTASGASAWSQAHVADLVGEGSGTANTVVRTTDGTTMLLDNVRPNDIGAGVRRLYTRQTLGAAAADFRVVQIPQSFANLVVKLWTQSDLAGVNVNTMRMRLSANTSATLTPDATANYHWGVVTGTNNAASASATGGDTSAFIGNTGGATSAFGAASKSYSEFTIAQYANTGSYHIISGQSFHVGATSASGIYLQSYGGMWTGGQPIYQLLIFLPGGGQFVTGSVMELWVE
jgi:hypothetical protein